MPAATATDGSGDFGAAVDSSRTNGTGTKSNLENGSSIQHHHRPRTNSSSSAARGESPLPAASSDALYLANPTLAELERHLRANGASWRGPLTIEQYLRREAHLSSQGLTKDNGLTYWVLVEGAGERQDRRILAGCETIRKRALVAKDGNVSDVICHGVASVFTPPAYRGRGYAARMMRDLAVKLRTWQTERTSCMFSVLYSDIGKQFYTKLGWNPFPSSHIELYPRSERIVDEPTLQPIVEADLHTLCARDEARLREKMANHRGNTAIAVIPDFKTIEWHHAREAFVSREMYQQAPTIKGAVVHKGSTRAWAIWTRVWYNPVPTEREENTMFILRLNVEDETRAGQGEVNRQAQIDCLASVLRVAQQEAYKWHMEKIEIWNPKEITQEAARQLSAEAKLIDREEDSIPSLQWYGKHEKQIDWLENEKYAWC